MTQPPPSRGRTALGVERLEDRTNPTPLALAFVQDGSPGGYSCGRIGPTYTEPPPPAGSPPNPSIGTIATQLGQFLQTLWDLPHKL